MVRGRGCTHQVDALGTLTAPVPFGLPLRLFLEAKHRTKEPVGIEVVRNAYGVLADVNQFCPAGATSRRASNQYSLVSTRGFTAHAVDYARTHGIALHDFSGDAWQPVRDVVDHALTVLKPLLEGSTTARPVPLWSLRRLLRAALGTLERSADDDGPAPRPDVDPVSTTERVVAEAASAPVKGTISRRQLVDLVPGLVELAQRHDRSLLIGYPDGELLLALRPDHTDQLDTYLRAHASAAGSGAVPPVRVRLVFSPVAPVHRPAGGGLTGDWVIEPVEGPLTFRLRLGLPEGFERGLLTSDGAPTHPGRPTGSITIHRRGTAHRLVYELEVPGGGDDGPNRSLRSRRKNKRVAITAAALRPELRRASGGEPPAASDATTHAPPVTPPRPRKPRPAVRVVEQEPVVDDAQWDDDEVAALLALLEARATASPGRRRSLSRERDRASAERALLVLHALASARGELDRDGICARLDTDPARHFTRGTLAVTTAAKALKHRGEVAESRGDVLTSLSRDRRAGRGGVSSVVVRREFVEPLRAQARRMARAQAGAASSSSVRTSTNSRTAVAVPRQRTRRTVSTRR